MGWLLTLILALPQGGANVEFGMWFSQKSYCEFAVEKFSEQPYRIKFIDGRSASGKPLDLSCRELQPDELHLIPQHLQYKMLQKNDVFAVPLSGN